MPCRARVRGGAAMPQVKTAGGLNMYYEIHGDGYPFVLIAGTGSHGAKWNLFQTPFFSRHFRTIIYDHRGTGKSDHPDVDYTIEMFAADLAQMLEALGIERANILGHSMGGQVALQFAIDYPDLVNKLILADTGSGYFSGYSGHSRGIPLSQALELFESGGSVAERLKQSHLSDFWYSPEFRQRKDVMDQIVELAMQDEPPLKSYLRHIIARQNYQATDQLHRVRPPTLILVGAEDRHSTGTANFVRQCRHLHSMIPQSKLKLIPGARHGIFWEKADLVNQSILDWLQED